MTLKELDEYFNGFFSGFVPEELSSMLSSMFSCVVIRDESEETVPSCHRKIIVSMGPVACRHRMVSEGTVTIDTCNCPPVLRDN